MATYAPASDFDRDRSFTAVGVRTVNQGFVKTSAIDPESAAIGFDYTAATHTYRVRYNDETASVVTVRSADRYPEDYFYDDSAAPSAQKLSLARTSFERRYVGILYWSSGNNVPLSMPNDLNVSNPDGLVVERRLVFGARTAVPELASTGTSSYEGGGEFTYPPDATPFPFTWNGSVTLSVDWAARRIAGTVSVRRPSGAPGSGGSGTPAIEFPFDLTFSADGHITGSPSVSGRYMLADGYFFGPQASEMGFVFRYVDPVGGGDPRVLEYAGEMLLARK